MSSKSQLLEFPRGFIFAEQDVRVPASFEQSTLLPNLFVHPWLKVQADAGDGRFVVVLGVCVSSEDLSRRNPATLLLEALHESLGSFFSVLSTLTGRFAVIYGDEESSCVVTDATAMRSVFYAERGGVVASHALLVERGLGGAVERDPLPFHFGFPGNRTPFTRTKVLTPNTFVEVASGEVTRFWPMQAPANREVDEAARIALNSATISLQRASMGRSLSIGLTAGLDSRVIMATAINSGAEFDTYTYGVDRKTALDRGVASVLASDFGLRHTSVPRPNWTPELRSKLGEAYYAASHGRFVPGLMEYFDDPASLSLTGSLLEIAQTTYAPWRDSGSLPPVDVPTMTALHRIKMNARVQERIVAFGEAEWTERAESAFDEFFTDTDYGSAVELIDPFDLFYWEHRMGLWFGTSLVERDFYADTFSPFNSRAVFEALLGVREPHRENADAFYRMIAMVDPRLLQIPINPRRIPQRA